MAKDAYHETVKRALEKDGWTITHDPFPIRFDDLRVYADLGAEKIFTAQPESYKIVIEIKVLVELQRSKISNRHSDESTFIAF